MHFMLTRKGNYAFTLTNEQRRPPFIKTNGNISCFETTAEGKNNATDGNENKGTKTSATSVVVTPLFVNSLAVF